MPPPIQPGKAPSRPFRRRYRGSKRSQGEQGALLLIEAVRAFWQLGAWMVGWIVKRFR